MLSRSLRKILSTSIRKSVPTNSEKNFIRSDHLSGIKFQCCFLRIYTYLIGRCINTKTYNCWSCRKVFPCEGSYLLQLFKCRILKIPLSMKEHSVQVVKMCTKQCEFVVAQRIRRGQQMFSLYSRMWDDTALKNLFAKIRTQFTRRGKELLLSAAGVSAYNWEKMKITDKEIRAFKKEIEHAYHLRDSTVTCQQCHRRIIFDTQVPDVEYCDCTSGSAMQSSDNWVPFLERKDIIVWRKEDPESRGLYAYKVYACYDDVSAQDFLCVQLDTEYRKEWDQTAVELTILESDPQSNSDIIYWVMKWPRMFSNRDYVFNRRFKVDQKEKLMIVVNKCTEHPRCPQQPKNVRVKEYWSSMVIKPLREFNEPGIEFCLTYFDDPGVSIPSAITSWVALTGLPDFLARIRDAARQLAIRRRRNQYHWVPVPEPEPQPAPPKSASDVPGDPSPRVSLTSSPAHQDLQDSYLQLSTARLFL